MLDLRKFMTLKRPGIKGLNAPRSAAGGEPGVTVTISGISPDSGEGNETVTITGTNFEHDSVTIDTVRLVCPGDPENFVDITEINIVSDTSITFTVPAAQLNDCGNTAQIELRGDESVVVAANEANTYSWLSM